MRFDGDGLCGRSYGDVSKSFVQPAAGGGYGRGDMPMQRPFFEPAPRHGSPTARQRRVISALDQAVAADMYATSGRNLIDALRGKRGVSGRRPPRGRWGSGDALRGIQATNIARTVL